MEGVNSPSRGAAVFSPAPVFLERGAGSRVWDADGNEYTDFMMSFGALIHGHAHPKLVEVVSQAMAEGSHFASATSAEVEAAERFRRMVLSAEAVRFTNTGSEATMLALRLARAHTRRTKFLKFEGHYYGWYDAFLLNAHDLQKLRELTREYGIVLILDEVVTGFRYAPGGCQEYYSIQPDLSTFGKALGAGFPVGAVAGPRAILDRMRWGENMVLHYGTFNGHRLTMKVVAANLDLLSVNDTYRRLHALGDAAIAGLREVFRRRKMNAIVQGFGPMFQIYFTDRDAINDYRDYCTYVDATRYSRFVHLLLERGIYMTPSNGLHWIISTAHSEADVQALIEAADQACAALT